MTYIIEHYLNNNEVLPFVTAQMELGIVALDTESKIMVATGRKGVRINQKEKKTKNQNILIKIRKENHPGIYTFNEGREFVE